MQRPTAILFDLDDTIIKFDAVTEPAWKKCLADFIRQHAIPHSLEELYAELEDVTQLYWGDPEQHRRGRANIKQARRDVAALLLNRFHISNSQWSEELADHYTAYHHELVTLFPNSISVLDTLKEKGIRMALVTNGTSLEQRGKIKRFALEGYFEFALIEEEIGFGKPDPRVFELALQKLNLPAEQVWMVGDNISWEIAPPQTLGIRTVWHDYRNHGLPEDCGCTPDYCIHDIAELLTILYHT